MFVSLEAYLSGVPLGELEFDDSTTFQEVLDQCQEQVQTKWTKQIKLFLGHGGPKILNMKDVENTWEQNKPIVVYNELYNIPKYKKMFEKDPECIIQAAKEGKLDEVKQLLLAGADPNIANNNGTTPLYWVSFYGYNKVVALLLKHNADPNFANNSGNTPLHEASLCGYDKVVALLLENKANPNLVNNSDNTPLHEASLCGNDKVVALLLENKADPNLANNNGETPLHWASRNGHDKVVALLLENKADPNVVNKDGNTPLSWAYQKEHVKVVRLLLSYMKTSH